jgi:hypothetical protein
MVPKKQNDTKRVFVPKVSLHEMMSSQKTYKLNKNEHNIK